MPHWGHASGTDAVRVLPGRSDVVEERMALLRDHEQAVRETLGPERMHAETIFSETVDGVECLYWYSIQGEGGSGVESSGHWLLGPPRLLAAVHRHRLPAGGPRRPPARGDGRRRGRHRPLTGFPPGDNRVPRRAGASPPRARSPAHVT